MTDKKEVSPEISQYFSDMAKKRKNPHFPFKDKDLARKAAKLGVEAKRKKTVGDKEAPQG